MTKEQHQKILEDVSAFNSIVFADTWKPLETGFNGNNFYIEVNSNSETKAEKILDFLINRIKEFDKEENYKFSLKKESENLVVIKASYLI